MISEIDSTIRDVEVNKAIYEEANFAGRAEAIDFLEFHVLDRIESLFQNQEAPAKALESLRTKATKVKADLQEIDARMFQHLREQLRTAADKKLCFTKIIFEYLQVGIDDLKPVPQPGYDNLDVFVNELFSGGAVPEPTVRLAQEMVFYQKTPARIILEMAACVNQEDVFFDLGSGLGQVVNLVNLITGARATGIEYEPAYCDYARKSASVLGLTNVNFINEDARNADYASGTVFFLYTPFEGKMLEDVMNLLSGLQKQIRIFSYGPCATFLAQLNWLTCITGEVDTGYRLYEFRRVQVGELNSAVLTNLGLK